MFRLALLFFTFAFFVSAQTLKINKVEPPNWWTGMTKNKIQLMVYGEGLSGATAASKSGVKILGTSSFNDGYLFIDIEIPSDTKPGDYEIEVTSKGKTTKLNFPVQKRTGKKPAGFSSDDIIYLVMPDRFVNGDTKNDAVKGLSESVDRGFYDGRHGGDLQGIINKLDYIKELGFTALWLTPVVENNTFRSYHGYSATDFYSVDARLGDNALYKKMVEEAQKRGIKVILDHVANHFSKDHQWAKLLPHPGWVNGSFASPPPPVHHKQVFPDINSDSSTIKKVVEGWFTDYMPDFNQTNSFVANYITQNTIWWVEFAGLDGIREDTYPYNHEGYMAEWAKTILEEYPTMNIVAEVWTGEPSFLSYYQSGSRTRKNFDNYIKSLTDFGLRDVIYQWLEGRGNMYNVYSALAMDFLYGDPNELVTFVDNHDINRGMFGANGNIAKFKTAFTLLLTTRGIPQIFYGTEIGIKGTDHHGYLRADFPGGWKEDQRDAFTKEGRTSTENDLYNHLKKLIEIRRNNKAFTHGKLTHFPPVQDVYVYFREFNGERFMVAINGSDKERTVGFDNFGERLNGIFSGKDLLTDEEMKIASDRKLVLGAYQSVVLKLR
ncbi:MAG: cyclomaltodextrinase N-terminal domain-containing protein [Ignavibacteria bacterium]|nr:cyclomaltodextrinase N-terminal domain-containing protein [Ignavibacteria bacterium]